jgi:hypothetical protein
MSFISERALPNLKPHLLAYSAKDLYDLVQYGSKIEVPQVSKPVENRMKSDGSRVPEADTKPYPRWAVSNPEKRVQVESATGVASKKATIPPSNTEKGNKKPYHQKVCTICNANGHWYQDCRTVRPQTKKATVQPKEAEKTPDLAKAQGNGGEE